MKNLKSKTRPRILQKNELSEDNYFSKKLILNSPDDVLNIPIDQLKNLNICNLSGEFYQKIYDEAIDVENGKKILKDFKFHIETPLPPITKKINRNSKPKLIRNKSATKNISRSKEKTSPQKTKSFNSENIKKFRQNQRENCKSYDNLNKFDGNKLIIKNKYIEHPKIIKKKSLLEKLKFYIKYDTTFGESIGIIGSNKELGNWNTKQLIQLKWNKGNIWTGEINVDENNLEDFEFKFVILFNGNIKKWESGSNNKINYMQLLEQIKNKDIGNYNKYEYSYSKNDAELTLKCIWN